MLGTIFTVMGKAEGHGENWHGHVTALTVSPDYRRLGLAAALMNFLEDVSEKYVKIRIHATFLNMCSFFRKRAYFVDLFVRVSNKVAINMYTNLGYIVYRTVLEYYSGDPDEDAYGKNIGFYYILVCIFLYRSRYEESLFQRCQTKICNSLNTPSTA